MTQEQSPADMEDDFREAVEGHDAREVTVLPQRPILFLDEAEEADGEDL